MLKMNAQKAAIFVGIAAVAIAIAGYIFLPPGVEKVRYSQPERSTWWSGPSMLATKWNYFEQEGVEIEDRYWMTGKRALQALFDQQTDMVYVAGPPVVISSYNGKSVLVLAQTMSSRNILHLLPRVENAHDWYEHPIGLARGTISEFFLIEHLKKLGKLNLYKEGKLKLINRPHAESNFVALMQKTTNAAIIFEPFASVVTMDGTGNRGFTDVTDFSLYKVNCYIITTPATWKSRRSAILRVLAAIRRASNEVERDPQRAWDAVRPMLYYSEESELWANRDWNSVDFNLITDKKVVRSNLTLDSKIGVEGGLFKAEPNLDGPLSVMDDVDQYLRGRGL